MVFTNINLATIKNYNPKKNGYLYCLTKGGIINTKNFSKKKGKIYVNERGAMMECKELVFSKNESSSFYNQKLELQPGTTVKCDQEVVKKNNKYKISTSDCQICDFDSGKCE